MPAEVKTSTFTGNGVTRTSDIEDGSKLKKSYKDENVLSEHAYVLVEFSRDEESKSSSSAPSKKDKKDSKNKSKEKKEISYEDSLMHTPVTAKMSCTEQLIALEDNVRFRKAVGYNSFMPVSNIKIAYGNEDLDWDRPTVADIPYDGPGIFYSDGRLKAFTVNAPLLGTRFNYFYEVDYRNIKFLTSIYFHESHPQKEKTIVFKIPDWMNVDVIEMNLKGYDITKTTTLPKKFNEHFNITDDSDNSDEEDEEEEGKTKKKKSKKKKYNKTSSGTKFSYIVYTAKNLKTWKDEHNAQGPSYYMPHLLVISKSYKKDSKDSAVVPMMRDANDLYKWYRALIKNMDNDTQELKAFTKELVKGARTDMEKVEKVFYWVQDNIRYIAFEDGIAGFKPDDCQNVFEKRYGDCKGMANLTANMLRTLGFDARLTWIGTRRIAYNYSTPSVAVDNHMICTLILNGQRYFLDPTESYIALGDYGHRIQSKHVMIENGESFFIDSIPDLGYQRNKHEITENYTLDKQVLKGDAKISLKGESKVAIMNAYNETKSDRRATAIERYLSAGDVNVKVSDIKYSDFKDRKNDLVFTYKAEIHNQVYRNGENEIHINPDWKKELYDFDFDSTRQSPYDFNTNIYLVKNVTINIPAGWKVKSTPAPLQVKNPYFDFDLSFTVTGNQVIYRKSLIIPKGVLPLEVFKEWNAADEKLRNFYNENIILTR